MEPLANIYPVYRGSTIEEHWKVLTWKFLRDQHLSKYTLFISELVIVNCLLPYFFTSFFNRGTHYIVTEQIL